MYTRIHCVSNIQDAFCSNPIIDASITLSYVVWGDENLLYERQSWLLLDHPELPFSMQIIIDTHNTGILIWELLGKHKGLIYANNYHPAHSVSKLQYHWIRPKKWRGRGAVVIPNIHVSRTRGHGLHCISSQSNCHIERLAYQFDRGENQDDRLEYFSYRYQSSLCSI